MIKETKNTALLVLLIALAFTSFAAPYPSFAIGIKEQSIITDDTIKLGDIFYDLERNEERVLGHSPRPGEEMVLNARTLLRIATALDLPWRPTDTMTRVVLRREATIVGYDQIKEAIQTALYDEDVYGNYEISIPNQYHQIVLPADIEPGVTVTRIDVDARRKKFNVTLAAPSALNPIQQVQIKGRMFPVIKVPVLSSNIETGRTIKASDLKTISIKERDFSKDTIADAQKLIGMTPRRVIMAGRPVKESEIIAPQVIERGQILLLSLDNKLMNITTQVKALQNGAKGDIIRVVNTSSNQTLQAVITGDNQAKIVSY